MQNIVVNLEICTLYEGEPYGPAIISYNDNTFPSLSFRGVGLFRSGKLHKTPCTFVNGVNQGFSFSNMIDGRPQSASYCTYFLKNGETQHVDSKKAKTDVSGWQSFSGEINQEGRLNGYGKMWEEDGSVYIGGWKNHKKTFGRKYELEQDKTHTAYQLNCDD